MGFDVEVVVGLHCGANSGHFETSIIHCPTSEEGVKLASAAERAGEGSRAEQANKWAVRANKWAVGTNERMDERVAQYLLPNSCWF